MTWVVVDIGCIECGVSSNIVGTFATKAEADACIAPLEAALDWRQGGQNAFEVFELPPVGAVNEEYRGALVGVINPEAAP